MKSFQDIYDTACLHKGGAQEVEARLPTFYSPQELAARPNSDFLSLMSLRIFRAGLKHSMVDAKWPAFESVFNGFEPAFCANLSDEFIEGCLSKPELIRHYGKLKTIRANAVFVLEKSESHGSFGQYLAGWPIEDIVGLWFELKKYGAHLGGGSAASFLRMAGKDTFMLTNDVVAVLKNEAVVSKAPSSKRDLEAVQQAFNTWRAECGRPLCEISRIVSMAAT